MKIIALIKQVSDTAISLKINADATDIEYQNIPWVINPYDEYAVEEALRIKEKHGGSVTVISIGPDRIVDILRSSLAMDADEGVHVKDSVFDGSDAYSTGLILSKAVSISGYDIILCGRQAVDDGWGQVGSALAEILNIPSVSSILKLEISEDKKTAVAAREIDEGLEIVEVPLPALFTIQQGINKPRYASLPGIMKAKKKKIKVFDAGALGISPHEVGRNASRIHIKKLSYPPERKKGKVLRGDSKAMAKELANLLKNEAKVI
ncbi:MAG: electron transfer flavoprotein subunit beta/FixA family protein [Deltaproteobacteria bacterium]|nr:electron transfer flavoprotein subunit beta/FixA family protein [Deltaproteobacteria bacterium]MBI3754756.1 electron transfer flavoprotein subunit beta/FixA family protein [Deltaproteobacteria bacterium]